jgi:hypothetical protein
MLKPNPLQQAIAFVSLPVVWMKRRVVVENAMLLPHLVFAALFEESPQAFQDHLLPGGPQQVTAFWESMSDHPALVAHPMLDVADWKHVMVPLSIHGDGVPVTGTGRSWAKGVEA